MRLASFTGQFKRDVKLAEKRGKDMRKLHHVIKLLLTGAVLPAEFGDHPLKGEWKPSRDLHIEADWLLIYTADEKKVHLERTVKRRAINEAKRMR